MQDELPDINGSRQVTQKVKIELVVEIRKAFYDVLLTQQMLNILNDDIDRLTKSLSDAFAMYNNGMKDKTDYIRATLALNAARANVEIAESNLQEA